MRIATLTSSICLLVGSVAACGGSEAEVSDDPAAFCAALAQLDAVESDGQEFVDALTRLDRAAPDDVADATGELLAFIEQSNAIGTLETEERATAIEELAAREGDFDAAVETLEDFSVANCPDLGDALFGTGS